MNQGKLEVVIQMASEHRHSRNQQNKKDWNGEFNSDDHYIYYCGQESLRRNGVAVMVYKKSEMQYLNAISKTTDDLCSFLRQMIQYHSNPSLCPKQ